jgi:hypothetical protein
LDLVGETNWIKTNRWPNWDIFRKKEKLFESEQIRFFSLITAISGDLRMGFSLVWWSDFILVLAENMNACETMIFDISIFGWKF